VQCRLQSLACVPLRVPRGIRGYPQGYLWGGFTGGYPQGTPGYHWGYPSGHPRGMPGVHLRREACCRALQCCLQGLACAVGPLKQICLLKAAEPCRAMSLTESCVCTPASTPGHPGVPAGVPMGGFTGGTPRVLRGVLGGTHPRGIPGVHLGLEDCCRVACRVLHVLEGLSSRLA
jgi:hypothetical protein